MQEGISAATANSSNMVIFGLGNFIEKIHQMNPVNLRNMVKPLSVTCCKDSKTRSQHMAHKIIEAFLDKQSDEMLENPLFKRRLALAYSRAAAGTFGYCSCGVSLSAHVIINGDALTEHCPTCAKLHNNNRAEQCMQIMVEMRSTLSTEVLKLKKQSEELALIEGISIKSGDEADRSFEDTPRRVLKKCMDSRIKQLKAIDVALTRIDAGEFGICECCEEEIPIGRLRIVPFTRTCTRCKAATVH